MNDQWYFAYGSNLARDQKVNRTGPVREERRARLDGYRLAFNKRGTDGTGKANIVPDEGGTVWGVVYRCSPSALNDMDGHEGVSGGHYVRKTVRVRADGGEELDAVTYVAGSAYIHDSLTPSSEYLKTILRGAREHDLPDEYVRDLEAFGRHSNAGDKHRPA